MFGYLKPFKPEMKIKEYECYKSFYCGLCKTLRKEYGVLAPMFLNYDAAMLALLYKSTEKDGEAAFEKKHCFYCPAVKCLLSRSDRELSFAAAVLMSSVMFKAKDSIADKGFFEKIKALLLFPIVYRYGKKAKKKNPMVYFAVEKCYLDTAGVEKNYSGEVSLAAEPTADMMGEIVSFIPHLKRKGYRLGYFLGQFIYFADAADDLFEDIKRGNFNPFVNTRKEDIKKILECTVSEIKREYEKTEIYDMKSITDNFVYMGLDSVVKSIFSERKNKK